MKHLGTAVLNTERLMLRRFRESDAQAMYDNWASESAVTKYLTWPTHQSIAVTRRVITGWIADYGDVECYQWAIMLKSTGEPIGSIGAVKSDDAIGMVHVGYCIGSRWWHMGIMSEAFAAVIRYFFEEVGVNRIESRHDPNNPNSGKVMQKCGLLYEGRLVQGDRNNQGICDACLYGLTAEAYFKKRQQQKKRG